MAKYAMGGIIVNVNPSDDKISTFIQPGDYFFSRELPSQRAAKAIRHYLHTVSLDYLFDARD